ncbi:ground-like domain protein [Teladorsagia circumcincta]|uniref:Ground-like domain protein n=1 Tax=Teladorsagia circumcincta TaxID=45464 RepID=A0A2G9TYT3_TELCI|nr:ground-like domain protein [Teladorsagia circumcincta]
MSLSIRKQFQSYQSAPQYFPQQAPAYIQQAPQGYAVPYKKRLAYGVRTGEKSREDQMLAETQGLRRRVRRDTEAAFDPKCNSELLKEIILENMDATTAVAKRQIQEAATKKLGGRIDVVCSTGTFSYIVNTELYCETEKDGTTCFAFRQSS